MLLFFIGLRVLTNYVLGHIAWHLSLGMSLQILEQPGEIQSSVNIPSAVNQVCKDWWSYTDSLVPPNLVDQIDSGI